MTPLHLACWYGQKFVVELLLEHGANVNAKDRVSEFFTLNNDMSISNNDGAVDENGTKAISLLSKTSTLRVHHAFLNISLPSIIDDHDVKLNNFTFYVGRELKTTI